MACLIKISEFIKGVYGAEDATPPTPQTITRQCRKGMLKKKKKGKMWYVKWDVYQERTGNHLVDRVLSN